MQCTISLKCVSCIHVYRNGSLVVILGLVMHIRHFGARPKLFSSLENQLCSVSHVNIANKSNQLAKCSVLALDPVSPHLPTNE